MPGDTYRNASKEKWELHGSKATDNEVTIGCFQRIADAAESMEKSAKLVASNWLQLELERDTYKKLYIAAEKRENHLLRRIASLRGVITRMKKGLNK